MPPVNSIASARVTPLPPSPPLIVFAVNDREAGAYDARAARACAPGAARLASATRRPTIAASDRAGISERGTAPVVVNCTPTPPSPPSPPEVPVPPPDSPPAPPPLPPVMVLVLLLVLLPSTVPR